MEQPFKSRMMYALSLQFLDLDSPITSAVHVQVHLPALVFFSLTCGFRYTILAGGIDGARIDDRAIRTIDFDSQCTIAGNATNILIGADKEDFPIARHGKDFRFLGAIAVPGVRGCPLRNGHWSGSRRLPRWCYGQLRS